MASSQSTLAAYSLPDPNFTVAKKILSVVKEDEEVEKGMEAVVGDPDLFGAETLLLLAGSSTFDAQPAAAFDAEVCDSQDMSMEDVDCDNAGNNGGGLGVLCQGIEFLASLPSLPGLDLLCSITR